MLQRVFLLRLHLKRKGISEEKKKVKNSRILPILFKK